MRLKLLSCLVLFTSCITPFTPRGIESEAGSLVIEGDIIVYGDTKVYLSLLQELNSNYGDIRYLTHANVWVEGQQGDKYTGFPHMETNEPPYFLIDTRALSLEQQYKLCVHLPDNTLYESDFLPPLITPQIDTIDFTVNESGTAVDFHVTAYGDDNASRFYKWVYTDDWEVISSYNTSIYFDEISRVFRLYPPGLPYSPVFYCWNRSKSTTIIARTDHLQENIVYQQTLNTVYGNDDRINYLYSMELHQMSITKEAYTYWSILHRNTNEIGGIFAPQPSELYGNIRCISHPELKVFGYISAGTRSVKRFFVPTQDIGIYSPYICDPSYIDVILAQFEEDQRPTIFQYHGLGFRPVGTSPLPSDSDSWEWLPAPCVDCTTRGTKNKPAFWPNDHI